ncbi:hypothetical protein N5J06_01830 [Ralstonia sp. CHL-2022]|uniref:Apea-like HEPN domain-containing protein n=1 Tax=Ralstonia mojiangensis TaxID=2953895 RepID=A0ABT2L2G6_9RALS|nr:hypothetical protein [Ralstonia mojiangensis]MCT7309670.1 hypothetical protein [Ralstonia mojiangensis]
MKSKNDYLKTAAENFLCVAPPQERLVGMEAVSAWFNEHNFAYPRYFAPDGSGIGFNEDGANAARLLTESLLKDNPRYYRGTDFQTLLSEVASELIRAIRSGSPHQDHKAFEEKIDSWLAAESEPRSHFIPCVISPYPSRTFSVGPVTFHSLHEFITAHEISTKNELDKLSYRQLLAYSTEQNAHWIAEVQTDGYDKTRAAEHADISIDIALVALQLVMPSSVCKEISRSTARTTPQQIGIFQKKGNNLSVMVARVDPCFSYSAQYFDHILRENEKILQSVGNRVKAFVQGESNLIRLDQSWCDAAYWFHEGLSEKLDTVAITKMETSIEVLLSAQSTQGCKDRLLKSFQAFYELSAKQFLKENDPRTVIQFISSVVTARSRVLHGTWSTLNYRKPAQDERRHRYEIESLARDLITHFTLRLDHYKKTDKPEDDITKFLDWVSTQERDT